MPTNAQLLAAEGELIIRYRGKVYTAKLTGQKLVTALDFISRAKGSKRINRIPPNDKERIYDLYEDGLSISAIAAITGYSYTGVRNILITQCAMPVKRQYSKAYKLKVMDDMKYNGLSVEQAAQKYGCACTSVRNWRNQYERGEL